MDLLKRIVELLGQRLEEVVVLLILDLARAANPDCLCVVDKLPLLAGLLDLLGLGLVLLGLLLLVNVGNVNLIVVLLLLHSSLSLILLLLLLGILVRDLDLLGLGGLQVDGEVDELRVALDEGPELILLQVLSGILLDLHGDLGTAAKGIATGILGDCEGSISLGDPHHLVVVVVLGDNGHGISNKVNGVETNTELSDEVHVTLLGHLLKEAGGSRLGDSSQVVPEVVCCHADSSVRDADGASILVSGDADLELGLVTVAQHRGIGEREETDLVQGVRGVRDQLTQEDLLLGIQRVNDDVHQAPDLGLELLLAASLFELGLLLGGEPVIGHG
mmetsp:Transcript_26488/g.41502  ORF Transcript_26488/g.41502 Transcript_26488/m.41502 type:complete len:332 (-) Transcript_26488:197-1192(-)